MPPPLTPLTNAASAPDDVTLATVDDPRFARDDAALPIPQRSEPVVATVTVIAESGSWSQDLVHFLGSEGFAVFIDPTGDSAFDYRSQAADAAIIDLGLATPSATAICAAWRRRSIAPILAIADSRDEATVLAAFAAGADHVAIRDVTSRQIVAHLRSLLRRVPPRRTSALAPSATAHVRLGDDLRSAVVHGHTVRLTEAEFQMLALLLDRSGKVVTRAQLAKTVMYDSSSARAVDFFVRRLREKLEEADTRRRIVAVRGVGFRFEVDGEQVEGAGADGEVGR